MIPFFLFPLIAGIFLCRLMWLFSMWQLNRERKLLQVKTSIVIIKLDTLFANVIGIEESA